MKKMLLFCLLVGLTSFSVSAQYFQWAKKQEGANGGTAIASGSSIVATVGTFNSIISIGNQVFTSQDSFSTYLAVQDHNGNNLWAKHIVSPNHSYNQPGVAIDANQNIIVSGVFTDSLYIDGLLFKGSITNKKGIYVVKFSPTGTLIWARSSNITTGNLTTYTSKTSVSVDGTGNVVVAGGFSNTLTFNGTSITAHTFYGNAFVVKYSSNGTFQWVSCVGNSSFDDYNVTVNASTNGNIYLSNTYGTVTNPYSGFTITKVNHAGTILWNKRHFGTTIIDIDLAIDDSENAYITGCFFAPITINGTTLTPTAGSLFIAKLNAAGNWIWIRTVASQLNTSSSGGQINPKASICFSPTNELAIAGQFIGSAHFNNIAISSGQGVGTNTFIAKLDTSGIPIWVNNISGSQASLNEHSDLSTDLNGNFFVAGLFMSNAQFSATLLSSLFFPSYLTKVTNEANSISGTVFLDANSNGIKDASESPFGQVVLQSAPGPIYGISSPDGTYNMYLPAGTNTISIPNPPRYHTAFPASHNVTFTGSNQTQTGKDFALQPIPNSNDVKVTVTSITPARPGFNAKYRLTFHNFGTTTLSDTLKFTHNTGNLTFISSSVTPVSNSNGKMVWYYQNLLPNETRNIDVTFSVPTTTLLGTPLTAIASIKPFAIDLFQADNIDTLNHVVIGSYDPNDKQVDKTMLSPTVAANGEYLDYTIRFQNTGTDTAFTVVVTDRISSKLNLADFEMLSASHNYKVNVVDGNTLEWRFDNILLPDSNRNEPASHGFIRFRMKSKVGLLPGDSITNQAAIFFDYNAPVITNYAVTRITLTNGIKENKTANIQAFRLYPNPAKNYVMVAAEFKKNTSATVSLVNLLGQTISKVNLPANDQIHYQMPLNELPKGVYLIKLQTETGMQTQRLVIQ